MSLLEACWRSLVLGIVQGITEFLPISSTAHLKVVPLLLGWGDPGVAFTAVIQLGSILAVLAYFRLDLLEERGDAVVRTIRLYRRLLAGEIPARDVWSTLHAYNKVGVTRGPLEILH